MAADDDAHLYLNKSLQKIKASKLHHWFLQNHRDRGGVRQPDNLQPKAETSSSLHRFNLSVAEPISSKGSSFFVHLSLF